MNTYTFTLAGAKLVALPSGALWWPDEALLCVSDLHLGKSERIARNGGALLPPYETRDTLFRLDADIRETTPRTVVCLGDSFDDLDAANALTEEQTLWITRLMAGRRWIWIEGNHDPGPIDFGGMHLAELHTPPLYFRHIARPGTSAEVSGHFHPKASVSRRGHRLTRPCFLLDSDRVILPAYGTYTGGLHSDHEALNNLMRAEALAILLAKPPHPIPMPRS